MGAWVVLLKNRRGIKDKDDTKIQSDQEYDVDYAMAELDCWIRKTVSDVLHCAVLHFVIRLLFRLFGTIFTRRQRVFYLCYRCNLFIFNVFD